MIQRIQSIFLLIASIFGSATFIASTDLDIMESFPIKNILIFSSILWALWSLFSYKNRNKQRFLNINNVVINLVLLGLLFYYLLNIPGGLHFPEKGIELGFPLLSIVCLLIANYYIGKDEKLVKSVDRLR